jgi:hypothetical protein
MFPNYIIQHLQSCVANEQHPKRFMCSLSLGHSNESTLSLVEQNQF